MFNCEILADSLSPQGQRLTTMKITFPRFILAELNTHRMFSRNSASSRAIPFKKMVQMVEENPFIPIAWQKDHKGMQGTEYFNKEESESKIVEWEYARHSAIDHTKELHQKGVTKQLCNRLLEPFMWHTVIVTATEWENFFKLRCPKIHHAATGKYYRSLKDWNNVDKEIQWNNLSCLHPENKSQADIHIQAIAELMWDALNESTPKQLQAGEWHIPFGDNFDNEKLLEISSKDLGYNLGNKSWNKDIVTKYRIKIATARCARISYETLGDSPKIDYEADIKLHDMLLESGHMSPFEHCAKAMSDEECWSYVRGVRYLNGTVSMFDKNAYGWCKNFRGFIQYRHIVENQ